MQNGGNEEKKEMEMEIRGKYLAASISTVFTKKLASVLKKKERMLESERDEDQVLEYIYIYNFQRSNLFVHRFFFYYLVKGRGIICIRGEKNYYIRALDALIARLFVNTKH